MSPSDDNLATLLPALMHLLHSRFASETLALMVESEITLPQMVTLYALRMGGTMSVSGIQAHLQLSASATSHLVDRLYAKGLVDRVEDPEDRRQKQVSITAAGTELIERLHTARAAQLARAAQDIEPDLRRRLAPLVAEAIEQLRRNNGGPPGCPES